MTFRFLPKRLHEELVANKHYLDGYTLQLVPVVKLFMFDDYGFWLLWKVLPINHNMAYGLVDYGDGHPHIGYIDLFSLDRRRGKKGLPVQFDPAFKPSYRLQTYLAASVLVGSYTEDEQLFQNLLKAKESRQKFLVPKPAMN